MRQGLAVRGHDEEEGNLSQLLKCRSQDKTDIGEWLQNGTYQSHDINNEIIQLMANQLLRGLLDEIRSAEWYSLIADETDTSGAEQLGISLRWVDSSYTVHEDFIALIQRYNRRCYSGIHNQIYTFTHESAANSVPWTSI